MGRAWSIGLSLVVWLGVACGDDDDDDTQPAVDAGTDAEAPGSDAAADAAVDAGPEGCEIAAPLVAGTPETDALASAPARCGMADYSWYTGPELGEVVSRQDRQDLSVAEIEAAIAVARLETPRAPEHEVAVETIVYRTQDRGALVESSALLAYPTDAEPGASFDVILSLHGTSGFTHGCGATTVTAAAAASAVVASLGYVVVAPDYLGLESAGAEYPGPLPYLIGEPTAMASLDAARAAMRAVAAGEAPCATTRVLSAGLSQGGHAALWVDRLAPYYARELTLAGTVAWVPPADLVAHVDRALREIVPLSTLAGPMFWTQSVWYGWEDRLDEALVPPWDVDLPTLLEAECRPDVQVDTLDELYQPGLLATVAQTSIADVDPFGCPLVEASLLTTSTERIGPGDASYGILFVVGGADQLVAPDIERAAFDTLCDSGLPVQYLECEGAGHGEAVAWSFSEAMTFLEDRAAGVPFTAECDRPAATRCLGTP